LTHHVEHIDRRYAVEWLNYHHLLYFWLVVKHGGVLPAAKSLRLAHSTVSSQIKELETALGEQLFDRSRRRLQLTEVGKLAFRYAEEIFPLGQEFLETLKGRPTGRPTRLSVGVTQAMPKLIVRELLGPAFALDEAVYLECVEDSHDRLLAELATHNLDVVLADAPVAPGSHVRAFNHQLGECGLSFFAQPKLARRLRHEFPASLDEQPMLMPCTHSVLRRALEQWFESNSVRPEIVAEFADSALLKVMGQDGRGIFCTPSVIEDAVVEQYGVSVVGRTDDVVERFFAISVERRLKNPAVVAICSNARSELFASAR
jgi:LysR family transcriptional activator of nhaA